MFYKDRFDAPVYATSEGFLSNILSPEAIPASAKQQLDAITTPVMLTNHDYVITFANTASLKLFAQINEKAGLPLESIIGINIADWLDNPLYCSIAFTLKVTPFTNARCEFSGAFIDWDVVSKHAYSHDFLETTLCLTA